VNSLFKKTKKKKYTRLKILEGCPQKSGAANKIFTGSPKKPNSAARKLVKIKLANEKITTAHIPGEGHKLMKFSSVLFRGCRVRDTPGILYRVMRGIYGYNLRTVVHRKKGRSKYGTPHLRIFLRKLGVK
jgi:small subunit ribosomal protein S12